MENMASAFFDDLHFAKDPYMAVSLRIDTRRIPPLTLKAALLREEMSYKKHTNKERLSRKEKEHAERTGQKPPDEKSPAGTRAV